MKLTEEDKQILFSDSAISFGKDGNGVMTTMKALEGLKEKWYWEAKNDTF